MRFLYALPILIFCQTIFFAQTPKKIKGAKIAGEILRYEKFQSQYAEERNVDVWLPPDYGKDKRKRYAVLYMHDGQMLFDGASTWNNQEWKIDETMTRLIAENKIREAIVVGIWNTPQRTTEFSPQKAFDLVNRKNLKSSPLIKQPEGLSDKYLKFLVYEIKPFIDKNYLTLADRKNTFVAGSSMGGLMSLYAIGEYPEIFGGAACISTHFPLGKGIILGYLEKFLPSPKTHKIYFDYGTETLDADYESYQNKADKIMKKRGYKKDKNWITFKFDGADHTENSWSKRTEFPLIFLLGK